MNFLKVLFFFCSAFTATLLAYSIVTSLFSHQQHDFTSPTHPSHKIITLSYFFRHLGFLVRLSVLMETIQSWNSIYPYNHLYLFRILLFMLSRGSFLFLFFYHFFSFISFSSLIYTLVSHESTFSQLFTLQEKRRIVQFLFDRRQVGSIENRYWWKFKVLSKNPSQKNPSKNNRKMYLEEIVLDGFKSYANRTVISGFDSKFNAITGLNGSGKSNILDAICFVLGITNLSQVGLWRMVLNGV